MNNTGPRTTVGTTLSRGTQYVNIFLILRIYYTLCRLWKPSIFYFLSNL